MHSPVCGEEEFSLEVKRRQDPDFWVRARFAYGFLGQYARAEYGFLKSVDGHLVYGEWWPALKLVCCQPWKDPKAYKPVACATH